MQHCKALRTRTWFAISLILVLALFFLGCTTGGGDFTYEGTDTITITKYIGAGGDVIIPSKINGKPVTGIGEYAFYDCDSLTGINIPDSVTIIGDCAFYNCDGLTSVAIPASVTSIDSYALADCANLESVTFEGTITSDNFGLINSIGIHSPFDGDLRDKYLNGGSRTYTTTPPVTKSSIWAKQQSILEKLIRLVLTGRSTGTREASTLPEV